MTSKKFREDCNALLDLFNSGKCNADVLRHSMASLVLERDKVLYPPDVIHAVKQGEVYDWSKDGGY